MCSPMDKRQDRISSLPDEVIHQILSYLKSTIFAVRTSILSKRWKLIWTTLPFLYFDERCSKPKSMAIDYVFSCRNRNSKILKLEIRDSLNPDNLPYWVKCAIDHNVQELSIRTNYEYSLHIFSSVSLKKLTLIKDGDLGLTLVKDCWYLPCLTSLRLERINLPDSLTLPALTALHLVYCKLPGIVWNFPALISLKLEFVGIPVYKNDFFSALVSLQNLTLSFGVDCMTDCLISCPQLVNLELKAVGNFRCFNVVGVVICAPKLRNVNIDGIFTIFCGGSKLENVNINLHGFLINKGIMPWVMLKQYYRRLMFMFQELGSAEILTLDVDTIEALSALYDLLERAPSPFYNLKHVKLPQGYKASSVSDTTKSYLLGGSPGATMVTSLPQNNVISHIAPVPLIAQNTPNTELVDTQGIHKKVCSDKLEMSVQEEQEIKNSGVVDGNVRQVDPLVQGLRGLVLNAPKAVNDLASSSRGNTDNVLWQGPEVNSEFVGLLDLITKKYPETFEHFAIKSKKLRTMKLNMLCTSVNAFITTTMTEIDTEMITEYRKQFADLQSSFNLNWLVSHLNHIEQLQFHAVDSCNDGYIGDDLFSGP